MYCSLWHILQSHCDSQEELPNCICYAIQFYSPSVKCIKAQIIYQPNCVSCVVLFITVYAGRDGWVTGRKQA